MLDLIILVFLEEQIMQRYQILVYLVQYMEILMSEDW